MILYTVRKVHSFAYLKSYIVLAQTNVQMPELFYHEEGIYVVKIKNSLEREEILYSGPYTISGMPFLLKKWPPTLNFLSEVPSIILLWIRSYNLPLNYWEPKPLTKNASHFGEPLFVDECTKNHSTISYARVLVDINITQELSKDI